MSSFTFSKMHGAGNDFIVTECFPEFTRNAPGKLSGLFIKTLCNRHRGVGADGLIILQRKSSEGTLDSPPPCFQMNFFNSDGSVADMCGNGLRCAAYYAWRYMLNKDPSLRRINFYTGAGCLSTELLEDGGVKIEIPLKVNIREMEIGNRRCFFLNTGVPHLVIPSENISSIDISQEGKFYRYHKEFEPDGTNVDFIELSEDQSGCIPIRTYERGVEGETSACGTGIAAAGAVVAGAYGYQAPIKFKTQDNDILTIEFCSSDNIVRDGCFLLLTGPVEEVFRGRYRD